MGFRACVTFLWVLLAANSCAPVHSSVAVPDCLLAALERASCTPENKETNLCLAGAIEPQTGRSSEPGRVQALRYLINTPRFPVSEIQMQEFALGLMFSCKEWSPEGDWFRSPELVGGPLRRTFRKGNYTLQVDVQWLLSAHAVAVQINMFKGVVEASSGVNQQQR